MIEQRCFYQLVGTGAPVPSSEECVTQSNRGIRGVVGVKSCRPNNTMGLAIDNGKAAKVITQSIIEKCGENLRPPAVSRRMLLPN